jgi:hypothetical protein
MDESDDASRAAVSANEEDDVKMIILDEAIFWRDVKDILSIASPIIKVMRKTDNTESQMLGKIYKRMFDISELLSASKISWAPQAAEVHTARWEYLHGVMHAAAYALDPEYIWIEGDWDDATQEGFLTVVERLCLWLEIRSSPCVQKAITELSLTSPSVVARISRAMQQYGRAVCAPKTVFSANRSWSRALERCRRTGGGPRIAHIYRTSKPLLLLY